jgi:hypothetical protein
MKALSLFVISLVCISIFSCMIPVGLSASSVDVTINPIYYNENPVTVIINTSTFTVGEEYGFFRPEYVYETGLVKKLVQDKNFTASGATTEITNTSFDASGNWSIKNALGIEVGHFWVHPSSIFNIDVSNTSLFYQKNYTINITVQKGTLPNCWVDIYNNATKEKIIHHNLIDNNVSINSNQFPRAGEYIVQACKDLDEPIDNYNSPNMPNEKGYYSQFYGNATAIANYVWSRDGPWDPPEYYTIGSPIYVSASKPTLNAIGSNTVYWNFPGTISYSVLDVNGAELTNFAVKVFNEQKVDVTNYININITSGKVTVVHDSWGKESNVFGNTGSWSLLISKDIDGDGLNEYNGSVAFNVAPAPDTLTSDLVVQVSTSKIISGQKTSFYINTTSLTTENLTGIIVEFYDTQGNKMKLDDKFGSITSDKLKGTNIVLDDYILPLGNYHIKARNLTHGTSQHATIEVSSIQVSIQDMTYLIWKFDINKDLTFVTRYENQVIEGKLFIYNIKKEGNLYKTWVDTGNDSIALSTNQSSVTLANVHALELPEGASEKPIKFMFQVSGSGNVPGYVGNEIMVRIPDVVISPQVLTLNELVTLSVRVQGRGSNLPGFFVSIQPPGITPKLNKTTDSEGLAIFEFLPRDVGDVIISIENRTSTTTAQVTGYTLYVEAPASVNEGSTFSVVVRSGGPNGPTIHDATVRFNGVDRTQDYTFTAPEVIDSVVYTIRASKQGYTSATTTITVLNVPRLHIITERNIYRLGKERYVFSVCIVNDMGTAVMGAQVFFDNVTFTSGLNGNVNLPTPVETGNYTLKVSKFGYIGEEISIEFLSQELPKRIPGFELLFVTIALACAVALWHRKKK